MNEVHFDHKVAAEKAAAEYNTAEENLVAAEKAAVKAEAAKVAADAAIMRHKARSEAAAIKAAAEFQAFVDEMVVVKGMAETADHKAAVKSAADFKAIAGKIIAKKAKEHMAIERIGAAHVSDFSPARAARSNVVEMSVGGMLRLAAPSGSTPISSDPNVVVIVFNDAWFAHAVGMGQATISGLGTVLSDKMCIYVH